MSGRSSLKRTPPGVGGKRDASPSSSRVRLEDDATLRSSNPFPQVEENVEKSSGEVPDTQLQNAVKSLEDVRALMGSLQEQDSIVAEIRRTVALQRVADKAALQEFMRDVGRGWKAVKEDLLAEVRAMVDSIKSTTGEQSLAIHALETKNLEIVNRVEAIERLGWRHTDPLHEVVPRIIEEPLVWSRGASDLLAEGQRLADTRCHKYTAAVQRLVSETEIRRSAARNASARDPNNFQRFDEKHQACSFVSCSSTVKREDPVLSPSVSRARLLPSRSTQTVRTPMSSSPERRCDISSGGSYVPSKSLSSSPRPSRAAQALETTSPQARKHSPHGGSLAVEVPHQHFSFSGPCRTALP